MTQTTLRIGGVPEHFNLPIHLAIENNEFEKQGINLEWTTFKGGTGQMTKALRNDEVDACILLTEGIIADVIRGNPSKIISLYVKTPLNWGVHTGMNNLLDRYKNVYSKKYAISRFGSGSHLMAIVDANSKGYNLEKEQFVVIKNLEGALEALEKNEADVFYWEKYTTKPYVEKGLLRRLGSYISPWPCFVIAATDKVLEKHPLEIIRMLRIIHGSCDNFMMSKDSVNQVSERYQQEIQDVERWFHSTEWAVHGWVSNKMISSIIYHLKSAGIVAQDASIPELIWKRTI